MKELVTVFAALAVAGAAVAADSNIVGYQVNSSIGTYETTGPTFITIGEQVNPTWQLGEIKVKGWEAGLDFIQILDPADANVALFATYIDEATSLLWMGDLSVVGWWNADFDTPLDGETFTAGTAMLCSVASSGVEITYAGEVLERSYTLDLSGQKFPLFANFTPVDLTLGDLEMTGFEAGSDFLQILNPANAKVALSATYIDEATSLLWMGDLSVVGWWNADFDTPLDSTPFPAGAAALGSLTSPAVTIKFPSPLGI